MAESPPASPASEAGPSETASGCGRLAASFSYRSSSWILDVARSTSPWRSNVASLG
jgi:hypothetical protein